MSWLNCDCSPVDLCIIQSCIDRCPVWCQAWNQMGLKGSCPLCKEDLAAQQSIENVAVNPAKITDFSTNTIANEGTHSLDEGMLLLPSLMIAENKTLIPVSTSEDADCDDETVKTIET